MYSTQSVGQRCLNVLGHTVLIAYSAAIGIASVALYFYLMVCPVSDFYWEAGGRFLLSTHVPNPDVLMVLGMSLASFPLAFFLGRSLIKFGSRLGRENQLRLAHVMTIVCSIVWFAAAAVIFIVGPAGTDRLHWLTALNMLVDPLFAIAGMVMTLRTMRHAQSTRDGVTEQAQPPAMTAAAA